MKILHFADAHIDMVTQGRHDPRSGLAVRTLDFLKALDQIIAIALEEHVDLVIFAGDAYKDRTPVPTYQREWGRRIARLSRAGIPTILLVGNHDLSPAAGRAHTLQEFDTLQVPHVHVASHLRLYTPDELGIPLQVLALPWINRSVLAASRSEKLSPGELASDLSDILETEIQGMLNGKVDPDVPLVFTAHASVEGALYGAERQVSLGTDFVLSPSLVKDRRFSYVALGHIHRPQDLNKGLQPPVIYPGSIERVDFGEAEDDKFCVLARIEPGRDTTVEWRRLEGRTFIDRYLKIKPGEDGANIQQQLVDLLPSPDVLKDAVIRIVVEHPEDVDSLIDEPSLRRLAADALEFHFIRRVQRPGRIRLDAEGGISGMDAQKVFELYLGTMNQTSEEAQELIELANGIMLSAEGLGTEEP